MQSYFDEYAWTSRDGGALSEVDSARESVARLNDGHHPLDPDSAVSTLNLAELH